MGYMSMLWGLLKYLMKWVFWKKEGNKLLTADT